MTITDAQKVLDFWFDPVHADLLFASNDAFDQKIRDNFYDTWEAGCQGLLSSWRTSAEGRLAEIIVLDQFSRNLQRGCPESFTQDLAALVLAQELYHHKDYDQLNQKEKQFALMPFMHAESSAVQTIAVSLFKELEDDEILYFAKLHQEVIERFGRFPGRNDALGRSSTPEEIKYLQDPERKF